jgi:hypothetical protein
MSTTGERPRVTDARPLLARIVNMNTDSPALRTLDSDPACCLLCTGSLGYLQRLYSACPRRDPGNRSYDNADSPGARPHEWALTRETGLLGFVIAVLGFYSCRLIVDEYLEPWKAPAQGILGRSITIDPQLIPSLHRPSRRRQVPASSPGH